VDLVHEGRIVTLLHFGHASVTSILELSSGAPPHQLMAHYLLCFRSRPHPFDHVCGIEKRRACDAMKVLKTVIMTVLKLQLAASMASVRSLSALSTRMTVSTEKPIIKMWMMLNQCQHHHRSTWSTTTTTDRYRRLPFSSSSSCTLSDNNNNSNSSNNSSNGGANKENARGIQDPTPSLLPTHLLPLLRRPIIVGYHLDEEHHWVAELECGHFQHVRHDPPMVERPWVLTLEGRTKFLGYPLTCKKCARDAPPDRVYPPKQD
jgi:hypothetical protein